MALNSTLVKSTVVAALGGLLFGFDTAVIAGATSDLSRHFQLTPGGLGLTVSIALWGTVVGALSAGIPGDRYGRRDSLRMLAMLYLVSALGCAFAPDWYFLVFSRFIGGLAIGGSSVLGPMYIAEIAPAQWRGRLVGFFQFNVVARNSGRLLLQLPGRARWIWARPNGAGNWASPAIPAAFFFVMLFQIPASPRWLARRARSMRRAACSSRSARKISTTEFSDIVSARCNWNRHTATSPCSQPEIPAADLPRGLHRRCSTSSRASTRSFIT